MRPKMEDLFTVVVNKESVVTAVSWNKLEMDTWISTEGTILESEFGLCCSTVCKQEFNAKSNRLRNL